MTNTPNITPAPRAPAGLGRRGKALWKAVCADYELGYTETEHLTLTCRTLDRIEALQEALQGEPLAVVGSKGQPRPNPLLAELRAEVVIASRLLEKLGIPDDGDADLYGSWQGLTPSQRGRKAARRRWASRGGGK